MNVEEKENIIEVKINAFKAAATEVILSASEKIQTQSLETTPNGTYTLAFTKPSGNYSIDIPHLELHLSLIHI